MVVAQPMADGAVLIDSDSGSCFELNRTGAEVWVRLCRGDERSQIVRALAEKYRIVEDEVRTDVDCLVEELARSGILVVAR